TLRLSGDPPLLSVLEIHNLESAAMPIGPFRCHYGRGRQHILFLHLVAIPPVGECHKPWPLSGHFRSATPAPIHHPSQAYHTIVSVRGNVVHNCKNKCI